MRWFDPIDQRWRDCPDPPPAGRIERHAPAPLSAEHARIWAAVEASATASSINSSQHQEKPPQ